MSVTRLVSVDDAAVMADLVTANRTFLAPFEPLRREDFFTAAGQLADIRAKLAEHERGGCLPLVIVDEDGSAAGRITVNGIVRGAFQSCSVGYWVAETANGRGLATAALREVVRVAFEELGLHRVQAETLVDNVRSQRVLEHLGFVRYGLAPTYLKIAGRWQDCVLFQLIAP